MCLNSEGVSSNGTCFEYKKSYLYLYGMNACYGALINDRVDAVETRIKIVVFVVNIHR